MPWNKARVRFTITQIVTLRGQDYDASMSVAQAAAADARGLADGDFTIEEFFLDGISREGVKYEILSIEEDIAPGKEGE